MKNSFYDEFFFPAANVQPQQRNKLASSAAATIIWNVYVKSQPKYVQDASFL
jgi:hypothetical protein